MATANCTSQKRTALITKYLNLSRELSLLKQELEACKVEAIELLGEGEHEIGIGKVTIKWTERPVLDQGKAKSFLTAGQLAECIKISSFYDVRVKGF